MECVDKCVYFGSILDVRFNEEGESGLNREPVGAIWLGVCKGLSLSLGVSVFKIRLIFVGLSFLLSPLVSLLLYGLLALMIPKKGEWIDNIDAEMVYRTKMVVYGGYLTFLVLSSYIISVSLF